MTNTPAACAASRALGGRERAVEADPAVEPELARRAARARVALRAVADDVVGELGVAVAQQPERAQDVGVALAGDEVGDGDERLRPAVGRRRAGGPCRGARRGRRAAPSARQRSAIPAELASTSRAWPSPARTAAAPAGEESAATREDVAAVDGDDDRRAGARAADRVAGGRGVVRVDEVEGEACGAARRSASASVGAAQAPQRPYVRGRGGATNGT